MPIDPSIILGIKPVQIQQTDPTEQFGKTLALQGLMQKNQMQDQDYQDNLAYKQAFKDAGGDASQIGSKLLQAGLPKQYLEFQKGDLANKLSQSTIGKNNIEALTKAAELNQKQLANVNDPQAAAQWTVSTFQDPTLGPLASRSGTLEQALARIPQNDSQQFQQWKTRNSLSPEKYIELNKPSIHMQDTGDSSNVVAIPGLGGTPTVLSTTKKTQTPDSIASTITARRGQDMTDFRARENTAQGKTQIVTDGDGNVSLVDKMTGLSRPVTDASGKPLSNTKALTETQGKAVMFGSRAQNADRILQGLENDISTTGLAAKRSLEGVPVVGGALSSAANVALSSEQQKVEQSQRDFVNALLRQESGAAISDSEFKNAQKQYFKQPGDSESVVQQKRQNRAIAIAGFKSMAGNKGTQDLNNNSKIGSNFSGIKFLGFE